MSNFQDILVCYDYHKIISKEANKVEIAFLVSVNGLFLYLHNEKNQPSPSEQEKDQILLFPGLMW